MATFLHGKNAAARNKRKMKMKKGITDSKKNND